MEIKIKIKIKDVEIEVDQKDLKELYEFLDSMFGKKTIDYVPYYYPRSRIWWDTPYWHTTSGYSNTRLDCKNDALTTGSWQNSAGTVSLTCASTKE